MGIIQLTISMQLLRFWRTIFLCWLKRETERKIIAKRFRVSFYLSILTGQPIRKFKSIIATENFNIYWSFFFLSSLNHWFVCTLRIIMEFVQIHVALYKPPMYVKISVFVCAQLLCYIKMWEPNVVRMRHRFDHLYSKETTLKRNEPSC